ncbi:glutaredoxin family protein [Thiopseudomonas acetoxidans]|uniref:Glutaredoxin family protein n=1 Tax=Thiopseudomonas acetoxidans TaxID=3041622 RepID=A0ABT7SMR3_9GAMM|nr:glutaredoxin family protein [Thiopseudomonas sp. CY1220]MDM7857460.1 glutaredoxin family protein [Thiopseudomonas sp. CY1220]
MLHCILFSTLGCHLCDEAEAILAPLLSVLPLQIEWVDIIEKEEWVERYGIHIPVVMRLDTQAELYWPFTTEQAYAFLK